MRAVARVAAVGGFAGLTGRWGIGAGAGAGGEVGPPSKEVALVDVAFPAVGIFGGESFRGGEEGFVASLVGPPEGDGASQVAAVEGAARGIPGGSQGRRLRSDIADVDVGGVVFVGAVELFGGGEEGLATVEGDAGGGEGGGVFIVAAGRDRAAGIGGRDEEGPIFGEVADEDVLRFVGFPWHQCLFGREE